MAQHATVYKSDQLDLQAAGRQAREHEWHETQRVEAGRRLAHVYNRDNEVLVLSQVMKQHGRFGVMRIGHNGDPMAAPACRVIGTANNAGMEEHYGVDIVA